MKPYPKQFESHAEAKAHLEQQGKLKFFGVENDTYVYNFFDHDGRWYHMLIHRSGKVEYEEMNSIQYHYWSQENR